MTDFLIHKFIKNYDDVKDSTVRNGYGTLSSITGIVCNITLFIVKFIMGIISNSISIMSDSFNNLSDCVSCIITLFGYKLAAKPADKDHPFGHGRIEYVTSFIIAIIIILVGIELLKSSIEKIIHPQAINFSWVVLISLIVSIVVKLWMSGFNKKLGKRIDSQTMIATSQDSLNDVISTTATIVALIASLFTSLPVDGVIGSLVSIFILYSGYGIIKDTVDILIGMPADKEMVKQIEEIMMSHNEIIGIHDLIIHNYGPGKCIGSCHAEVDGNASFFDAHDVIDNIEKEIEEKLHVMMTLHMDPVDTHDVNTKVLKEKMGNIIKSIDPMLSFHDFRVVAGKTHTNLIFDVLIPYDCKLNQEQIQEKINQSLKEEKITYYTVITFDREYC